MFSVARCLRGSAHRSRRRQSTSRWCPHSTPVLMEKEQRGRKGCPSERRHGPGGTGPGPWRRGEPPRRGPERRAAERLGVLGCAGGPRWALGGASARGTSRRARRSHRAAPRRAGQRRRALHAPGPARRDPQCAGERHRPMYGARRLPLGAHPGWARHAAVRAWVHSITGANTLADPLAEEATRARTCGVPRSR